MNAYAELVHELRKVQDTGDVMIDSLIKHVADSKVDALLRRSDPKVSNLHLAVERRVHRDGSKEL